MAIAKRVDRQVALAANDGNGSREAGIYTGFADTPPARACFYTNRGDLPGLCGCYRAHTQQAPFPRSAARTRPTRMHSLARTQLAQLRRELSHQDAIIDSSNKRSPDSERALKHARPPRDLRSLIPWVDIGIVPQQPSRQGWRTWHSAPNPYGTATSLARLVRPSRLYPPTCPSSSYSTLSIACTSSSNELTTSELEMRLAALFFIYQCLAALVLATPVPDPGVRVSVRGLPYDPVRPSPPRRPSPRPRPSPRRRPRPRLSKRPHVFREQLQIEIVHPNGQKVKETLRLVPLAPEGAPELYRVCAGNMANHVVFSVAGEKEEVPSFECEHFSSEAPSAPKLIAKRFSLGRWFFLSSEVAVENENHKKTYIYKKAQ